MNFPMSFPSNSGCPYSRLNPSHFESLVQASREQRCPTQISDPDMFITFHSPSCTQEAQSPADLGGLSPRSEDSLERTIKKLKLNTDESPEYRLFQQETQSILSDFQPWGNFQFEASQGVSTIEGTAGNGGLGSSLSGNSPQCPMFEKMRVSAENEGEKKPIEEEEDDEIIFLDSKPGNMGQNNQNNKVSDSKPSPCLRHLILDKKDSETMKLHKGAKTVHEVKMLGEHENLLWQSFVKVHSHIPGFPVNDTEHLDYITMILRHKAKHLFNIGKQQVKDLSKPGPESRQTACPTDTSSKPSSGENGTPEDPRQVFNNPYHKQLLEKCPVMHDFFQKENPPKTNTNPAPTPVPVIQIQPQTQTQIHPPLTPVQNPHILPAHCTNMPNPHIRMPVVPTTQQPLMPNTIIGDRSHAIHLLNSWFGMGFNHFVRAQNNPAMAGCPMQMMMGGGAGNKQPPGRERRGAFKAALTKMKGGPNRK